MNDIFSVPETVEAGVTPHLTYALFKNFARMRDGLTFFRANIEKKTRGVNLYLGRLTLNFVFLTSTNPKENQINE